MQHARSEMMSRSRGTLILTGVLAIVAGVVAIATPALASVTTAIFVGWVLVFVSAVMFMDEFDTADVGRAALSFVVAVLTFAAGMYLLVSLREGVFTLTVFLLLWLLGVGGAGFSAGAMVYGTPGAGTAVL